MPYASSGSVASQLTFMLAVPTQLLTASNWRLAPELVLELVSILGLMEKPEQALFEEALLWTHCTEVAHGIPAELGQTSSP